MFEQAMFCIAVFVLGLVVGYSLKSDNVTYKTNLAKFEIMYEKCMGHKNSTVNECKKLAEFKSKTCASGCE